MRYVGRRRLGAKSVVKAMKKDFLRESETEAIILRVYVYNPAEDLFGVYKHLFEFSETGKVWTKVDFRYLKMKTYGPFKLSLIIVTILLLGVELFFTLIKLTTRSMTADVYHNRVNAWTVIELLNTSLFGVTLALHIKTMLDMEATNSSVLEAINNFMGNGEFGDEVDTLDNLATLKIIELNFSAVNVWLCFLRICKSFKINNNLYLPYSVMRTAVPDMICFLVFFMGLLLSLVFMGHLAFGDSVLSFSTFYVSMWTCTRFVLGDFSYGELPYVNSSVAPIFYYAFVILVVMVSFNMAVAIIVDAYEKLKESRKELDYQFAEYSKAAQARTERFNLDAVAKLLLGIILILYLLNLIK